MISLKANKLENEKAIKDLENTIQKNKNINDEENQKKLEQLNDIISLSEQNKIEINKNKEIISNLNKDNKLKDNIIESNKNEILQLQIQIQSLNQVNENNNKEALEFKKQYDDLSNEIRIIKEEKDKIIKEKNQKDKSNKIRIK